MNNSRKHARITCMILLILFLIFTACDEVVLLNTMPVPAYEIRVIQDGGNLKLQSYTDGSPNNAHSAVLTGAAECINDSGRLVIATGANGSASNPDGPVNDPANVTGQNGVSLPGIAGEILKTSSMGVTIEMMVKIPENRIPGGAYWQNGSGTGSSCANPLFTISDSTAWTGRTSWFRIFNAQWWFYKNVWAQATLLPAEGQPGVDANVVQDLLADNKYRHVIVTIDKTYNGQMYIDGNLAISGNLLGTGNTASTGSHPITDADVLDFSQWETIYIWLGKTNLINRSTCQMYIYNFAIFGGILNSIDITVRKDILTRPGALNLEDIL